MAGRCRGRRVLLGRRQLFRGVGGVVNSPARPDALAADLKGILRSLGVIRYGRFERPEAGRGLGVVDELLALASPAAGGDLLGQVHRRVGDMQIHVRAGQVNILWKRDGSATLAHVMADYLDAALLAVLAYEDAQEDAAMGESDPPRCECDGCQDKAMRRGGVADTPAAPVSVDPAAQRTATCSYCNGTGVEEPIVFCACDRVAGDNSACPHHGPHGDAASLLVEEPHG